MRSLLLATAALGLSGALVVAHADVISIGLSEDGGPVSTVNSGSGNVAFSGSFGDFVVNNVSGTGTPPLAEPALLSNSINVQTASGGHTLEVFITEQGLSSPIGINNFLSSFTSNVFNGDVTSVVERTLIDTAGGLYTGTQLDAHTFTAIGTASSLDATPSLTTGYSETAEYIITTGPSCGPSGAACDVNDTIDISAVPEPASLAVLGFGLLGLGFIGRRRR